MKIGDGGTQICGNTQIAAQYASSLLSFSQDPTVLGSAVIAF